MKQIRVATVVILFAAVMCMAQVDDGGVDKWTQATGRAAGTDAKARDEAVAQALRTAVEESCGVFLTSQSKTEDYKAVYDKILANAVGYVREYKVAKVTIEGGMTVALVRARVSNRKFQEDWASIAHTLQQENNPRLVVGILEAVHQGGEKPAYEVKEGGIVMGKVEDFFLSKGVALIDRGTAENVTKRDVLLAAIKDDMTEIAALGARFHADAVVVGRATAKFGKELDVAGQKLYQYTATLNVRVIQCDSARVLTSKTFGPVTATTTQKGGGEDKVLAKLGEDSAPNLLAAVVEAWRSRSTVSRSVQLSVSGMDFEAWKVFKEEAAAVYGVQALRLREITEGVANIDLESRFGNEALADKLTELKKVKLSVQEITANRIKLKFQKP